MKSSIRLNESNVPTTSVIQSRSKGGNRNEGDDYAGKRRQPCLGHRACWFFESKNMPRNPHRSLRVLLGGSNRLGLRRLRRRVSSIRRPSERCGNVPRRSVCTDWMLTARSACSCHRFQKTTPAVCAFEQGLGRCVSNLLLLRPGLLLPGILVRHVRPLTWPFRLHPCRNRGIPVFVRLVRSASCVWREKRSHDGWRQPRASRSLPDLAHHASADAKHVLAGCAPARKPPIFLARVYGKQGVRS